MTLGVQTVRVVYAGNGATVTFAIPFNFYANTANVLVYLLDVDGLTLTAWAYGGDFSIAGTTITAVVAPALNQKLLVISGLALSQPLSLSDQSAFAPSGVMNQFDRLTAEIQQLEERINRCLTLPKHSALTNVSLEATILSADCMLAVNATGTALKMGPTRSEEHTSELQSRQYLVCR